MEIHQLPDLSDWLYVEVWTLEEAAMIWAAIDPADHIGKQLSDLDKIIPQVQYKKSWIYLRAFKEAVCSGTLPFVDAFEFNETENDYNAHQWIEKIESPNTPSHIKLITNLTRVRQSALLQWAKSKNILSYRQYLKSKQIVQPLITIQDSYSRTAPTELLLQAPPAFLDPSNPLSPEEVRAGVEAWEYVVRHRLHEKYPSPKAAIRKALDLISQDYGLTGNAKDGISVTFNWDKNGGVRSTRGK